MQRIGIVGVGEIGRAIAEGLCAPGGEPVRVLLSPRGANAAKALADRFEQAEVCADNQAVVDGADTVVLAVRVPDRREALAGLRFRDSQTVVSVMAGVSLAELRRELGTGADLVRAIPLPAVRERASITVTHPAHPVADALFDRLGGVQPTADEAEFGVYSALTGTLSTHYAYLAALTGWAAAQGVPAADAERYVRGLFRNLGRSLADPDRSLDRLAADHETPGGSNERIRTAWFDAANSAALTAALTDLLDRLR
ncbi:NAD(P)-binding domain-containing protein [Glycomyces sp. NPDC047010]|uniref:NAD(P)-binding domain-containing protein n=1 Tax=Glycomyces sp. NPDC047010 TaxID=3155023 RepID=UPI0033DBDDD9